MSNKTQLQTNNTKLDTLITRVNAAKDTAASLPEAGSGGGAEIETCNVTIGRRALPIQAVSLTTHTIDNGINVLIKENISLDTMIEHVICGSTVTVLTGYAIIPAYSVTGGAELVYKDSQKFWVFSIPKNPTEDVSIILRDDD